ELTVAQRNPSENSKLTHRKSRRLRKPRCLGTAGQPIRLAVCRLVPRKATAVKRSRSRLRVVARDGAPVQETRNRSTQAATDKPPVHKPQSPVAIRRARVTISKAHITLHGRRIAYRTGGWGPLLVLIHGITSSSATW